MAAFQVSGFHPEAELRMDLSCRIMINAGSDCMAAAVVKWKSGSTRVKNSLERGPRNLDAPSIFVPATTKVVRTSASLK